MRKMKAIISVALATVLIFCMSGCVGGGSAASADDCMSLVAKGTVAMIDTDRECEAFANYDEYKEKIVNGAAAELEAIGDLETMSLDDKDLSELVHAYAEATKSKAEGAQYIFDDAKKFNDMYYENGRNEQIRVLNELMDNYEFDVDDEHSPDLYAMAVEFTPHAIAMNEPFEFETDYGKVLFNPGGYTYRANAAHQYEDDLLCEIKNISFDIEDTAGYMDTAQFIEVYGQTNEEIVQIGGALKEKVGDYECSTGFEALAQGDSKKMAIAYNHDAANDMVMVKLLGIEDVYICYIPVE